MSEFRIEKRRTEAALTLTTGATVRGCFFLAGSAATHMGPERVADLLNAEPGFFPFELNTESNPYTVLYNRSQLVLVTLLEDTVEAQLDPGRQVQIRVMLSESLKGVISQTLCRKIGGGRVAALEVLIVTSAISNLICESKTFQVQSMMQVGKNVGMVTLNDALMDLVTKKLVTPEEAYAKAIDKPGIEVVMKRAGLSPNPPPAPQAPPAAAPTARP